MLQATLPFIMAFGMITAPNVGQADQYQNAFKSSSRAFYITSGTKAEVDNTFRVVEERYIPQVVKKYGPVTGYLGQIMIDKRISIKFSF